MGLSNRSGEMPPCRTLPRGRGSETLSASCIRMRPKTRTEPRPQGSGAYWISRVHSLTEAGRQFFTASRGRGSENVRLLRWFEKAGLLVKLVRRELQRRMGRRVRGRHSVAGGAGGLAVVFRTCRRFGVAGVSTIASHHFSFAAAYGRAYAAGTLCAVAPAALR
jgi:hypothetical protein